MCAAVVLAFVAATGCSATGGDGSESTENLENLATATAALGSTWPTPLAVSTLAGLRNMDPYGNYYLSGDIDGGNATWVPRQFMGTLDGRGNTIKNLIINDPYGRAAAFFETTSEAIIKRIHFTNIKSTGTNIAAVVVGVASDTSLDQVGVINATVSGKSEAAGLIGRQFGGSITRSYAKGTVSDAKGTTGGLVAYATGSIVESYAQVTVTGDTAGGNPTAGGVVGEMADGADVHDIYAVGSVKGRGRVGGVVGYARCSPGYGYLIYNGIARGGDIVDASRSGWSGAIGDYQTNCTAPVRWGALFYDTTSDQSGTHNTAYVTHYGYPANDLKAAVTPSGGVFCQWANGHCLDAGFSDPPWNAGTNQQHHTLRGVLDEGSQPL